jgi:hypothetical protein
MGATWTPLQYGETPLDHVRNDIPRERVVADGTAPGDGEWSRVYYAAVREDDSIVAYITAYAKQDGGVVYKNFTERSLPYFYTAPANVMAALTPTDNECAQEWRAKVREQATKNYGPSRLRDGMRVRFDATWNGRGEFIARKVGRRWEFARPDSGVGYLLRGWTKVAWAEA